jgi:hypothetical protein
MKKNPGLSDGTAYDPTTTHDMRVETLLPAVPILSPNAEILVQPFGVMESVPQHLMLPAASLQSDPNPTVPAIEPPFTSRKDGEDPDKAARRIVAEQAERQRVWEAKLSQL